MLPATVKLCCGISHQHFRNMTGLKHTAMAAIGQEITPVKLTDNILSNCPPGLRKEATVTQSKEFKDEELLYVKQGKEALQRAVEILEQQGGWQTEISEENGDVVLSKILPGIGKVFKLEAVLDATPEELHNQLFAKVEEMNKWNPNIKQIKVLHQVDKDTMVTHEVTAEAAGNLIGQRDFVSIRHCWKQKASFYLAGAAIQLESLPPQKGFVRAQGGPTCIILEPLEGDKNKSRFTWLLNMDLKGWLPKSIVNQALPQAQADFTRYLRKRLSARLTSVQR
ncbi:steroidogenic acute regulatory protein, mitochondrial-like [Polyodon spathula]|uniref:steroidogenic acute regulatory protein, mitochondrial-like n=1 Tax=Polyodon spathula TaxID=7913 RepID=UPI001B7D9714|nr:steroidogenic acute regulatory protein, mitochondrial-like [Polyodon spathula]